MATQQDLMTKKLPTGSSPKQPISNTERRGSRRCRITQLMRIRPSDPNKDHFEDMRGSVSVSRSGVFFQSSEAGYEVGMRLFVTMPYSRDPASMAREYLALVKPWLPGHFTKPIKARPGAPIDWGARSCVWGVERSI